MLNDIRSPATGLRTISRSVLPVSRTFASGEECFIYFHELLTRLTHDQDLNEVLQMLPQSALSAQP